jgi:general secretion pathway protein D
LIDKTSLIALKTSSLPMVANNLKAVVDMSQQFGITKSIASPRIHAMNNQRAVLSFVTNQVYFTIQKEVVQAPATIGGITNPTIVTNSTLNTIPIGIVIAIQPSINLDTQEITMNVHPTITRPDGDPVPDPVTPDSTIPNVQIRELDSVLKIKSGQIMVIGGLMEDRIDNEDRGTPFLMQIPFLGNLAKSVRKNTKTVQTVIFIKATIIPTKSSPISSDRNVYNTFIKERDTNPWEFRK